MESTSKWVAVVTYRSGKVTETPAKTQSEAWAIACEECNKNRPDAYGFGVDESAER